MRGGGSAADYNELHFTFDELADEGSEIGHDCERAFLPAR